MRYREAANALRRELGQIEAEIETRSEHVRIGRETVERYCQISAKRYVSLVRLNRQE